MDNPTIQDVKEQVTQLRQENRSIREIARMLGVTKYTVEKTLKELESDALLALRQTRQAEARTSQQVLVQTGRTEQQTGNGGLQTGQFVCNSVAQTGQFFYKSSYQPLSQAVLAACFTPETPLQQAESTEKAVKKRFFAGVSPFMLRYRKFLRQLQQKAREERVVWLSSIQKRNPQQVDELRVEAQALCQRHEVVYEKLLVSEVLDGVERYLERVLQTAPFQPNVLGLKCLKLSFDAELEALCRRAETADFFLEASDG